MVKRENIDRGYRDFQLDTSPPRLLYVEALVSHDRSRQADDLASRGQPGCSAFRRSPAISTRYPRIVFPNPAIELRA